MSRIYFHAEEGGAEVRGPERGLAGCLCGDLLVSILELSRFPAGAEHLMPLVRADHFIAKADERVRGTWLSTALRGFDNVLEGFETFELQINTALALGGDGLRWCARMHATCEIHGYVEASNARWLAEILRGARAHGPLRPNMGWESVIALLERAAGGPVVMSYSVCDQFPNRFVTTFQGPDDDGDAWYELPRAERWERSVTALRAAEAEYINGLEIKPGNWESWRCGAGHSAFDVLEAAREKRR